MALFLGLSGRRSALHSMALAALAVLTVPARLAWAATMVPDTHAKAPVPTLPMQKACHGCFPSDRKSCRDTLWKKCCIQEVLCHDNFCHEEVLGTLKPRDKIRVRSAFMSDDAVGAVMVDKGMSGKVLYVNETDDSAYIKFALDDFDDEFIQHWVHKRTFWDKIDLLGNSAGHRASQTVNCLNKCVLKASCVMNPEEMSKKQQKSHDECMRSCKADECNAEKKTCKKYLEGYMKCKHTIAQSGACSPMIERHSEL
eukprot:NODE_16863_length_973_cov_14.251773.p1 GENE.NODE_16863_length_973_cov_14.251773~~NODE_16863_length_973_cov_14.251773.p1  ORF type:complete len:271 (+),score=43.57 NODE_16863_length_973_cov_14.251773:49-813(+)